MVIDTSLGTHDDNSSDDTDDFEFSDGLCLSPVIEESQEPDDEHAAQEEPDVNAYASEPPAEYSEQPSGSHTAQESEKPSKDQVQIGKVIKSSRKRKHSKVEHALDDVITKFTAAQSSSEDSMNWKRNILNKKQHLKKRGWH